MKNKSYIIIFLAIAIFFGAICMCVFFHTGTVEDNIESNNCRFIVMGAGERNISLAEIGRDGRGIKSKQYIVPNWFYPSTEIKKGDKITVKHNGFILESSPMQFGEIYSMEHWDKKTGLSTVVIAD